MKHHVIFVPGLGDRRTYGQNIAIQLWRLFGLTPHYLALGWHTAEGFEVKLARLEQAITGLAVGGNAVSLVGASAGASAVMHALVRSPGVTGVVYICGKINHPETVLDEVYRRNPDFRESLATLQPLLTTLSPARRRHILNLHPSTDHSVPPADTRLAGTQERLIPGWGHMSGIFFGLVYGAPQIARFLRFSLKPKA